MRSVSTEKVPGHNVFELPSGVIFSSNFDNGNLARVEKSNRSGEYNVWTANDNMGTPVQSSHCAFFHFVVSGLEVGTVLKIRVCNASNHGALYKHDHRPVFRSTASNRKWARIRSPVKFTKADGSANLYFEHTVDLPDDKIYFAFTYPYSYAMVQDDMKVVRNHMNDLSNPDSIFMHHEVLTHSCDGRFVDLVTISSAEGADEGAREVLLSGLFPENGPDHPRPPSFPDKEVIFLSCRVHPGEVPAQWTFKGMMDILMDPTDLRGKELRRRFVFKMIPLLNPDGVYRGHFRMDQHGNNLNRYYTAPDPSNQPTIFAAKSLLDHYSAQGMLSAYVDCHAHASKRGCFIYGNVMDSLTDQVQNQLYCQLIAMNTPNFEYEGCLFSKEHMSRIDPGDAKKGLTAEGSGRVATYLNYGLIHSYTIESNYNCSRNGNDVPACMADPRPATYANDKDGHQYTPNPEKYTVAAYSSVGRAVLIAMLDIRDVNPCSRVPKSRHRTLENMRGKMMDMVKNRKEYKQAAKAMRNSAPSVAQLRRCGSGGSGGSGGGGGGGNNEGGGIGDQWRRCVSAPGSDEQDKHDHQQQQLRARAKSSDENARKQGRSKDKSGGGRAALGENGSSVSGHAVSKRTLGANPGGGGTKTYGGTKANVASGRGAGRNPLVSCVVGGSPRITPAADIRANAASTLGASVDEAAAAAAAMPAGNTLKDKIERQLAGTLAPGSPLSNGARKMMLPGERATGILPSVFPNGPHEQQQLLLQQQHQQQHLLMQQQFTHEMIGTMEGLNVVQQRQLQPKPLPVSGGPPLRNIVMMGSKKALSNATDRQQPPSEARDRTDAGASTSGHVRLAPLSPPEAADTGGASGAALKVPMRPPNSPTIAHAMAAAVMANRSGIEAAYAAAQVPGPTQAAQAGRRNPFPPKGSPRRATAGRGGTALAPTNGGSRIPVLARGSSKGRKSSNMAKRALAAL